MRYVEALLEVMRGKPARATPDAAVLALLDQKLPADVAAYLEAWARHEAGFVKVGDWWHDGRPHVIKGALRLGTTGGGDVIQLVLKTGKIVIKAHDGQGDVTHRSFEAFVFDRVFRAHEGGNVTDLDALVPKI
jgi:hypothetical protein